MNKKTKTPHFFQLQKSNDANSWRRTTIPGKLCMAYTICFFFSLIIVFKYLIDTHTCVIVKHTQKKTSSCFPLAWVNFSFFFLFSFTVSVCMVELDWVRNFHQWWNYTHFHIVLFLSALKSRFAAILWRIDEIQFNKLHRYTFHTYRTDFETETESSGPAVLLAPS